MATLSIKSKSVGLWHTATEIETIENNLKKTAKEILKGSQAPSGASYNVAYSINITTIREMANCISCASEELRGALRFPNQFKATFEMIGKKVHSYLVEELGAEDASKFYEAFDHFMHPNTQPKVPMQSIGR